MPEPQMNPQGVPGVQPQQRPGPLTAMRAPAQANVSPEVMQRASDARRAVATDPAVAARAATIRQQQAATPIVTDTAARDRVRAANIASWNKGHPGQTWGQ